MMVGKLVKWTKTGQIFIVTGETIGPLVLDRRTLIEDFFILYDVIEMKYEQMQRDTFKVYYRNGDIVDWSEGMPDINIDEIINSSPEKKQ